MKVLQIFSTSFPPTRLPFTTHLLLVFSQTFLTSSLLPLPTTSLPTLTPSSPPVLEALPSPSQASLPTPPSSASSPSLQELHLSGPNPPVLWCRR